MPYQITVREDGIVKILFSGTLECDELDRFVDDITRYLESAAPETPLHVLAVGDQAEIKFSPAVRKVFTNLNADPRSGKCATVGVDRYTRVLVGFILKATRRDNIRFFDSEELALVWLQS